ncbi:MAG: hypothetical protein ACOCZK_07840, partial [Planctomycetota bacterium]
APPSEQPSPDPRPVAPAHADDPEAAPPADQPSPDPDAAEVQTAQEAEDEAEEEAEEAAAVKRPGLIRWGGVVLLVALIAAGWALFELLLEPMLAERLRRAIQHENMALSQQTAIDIDLFATRASMRQAALQEWNEQASHTIIAAEEATVDIGLMASLADRDMVFDRLALTRASFSARRFPDGTLPDFLQPPEEELPEDAEIEDQEPPTDWVAIYKRWKPWLDRARRYMSRGEDKGEEEAERPIQIDPRRDSVRYEPFAGPYNRRVPRMLIRELAFDGERIELPERQATAETAPDPLDIGAWQLQGSMVTPILDPGERTELQGRFTTRAAGAIVLERFWRESGRGELAIVWDGVDLAHLASATVAGEQVAAYKLSGPTHIAVDAAWTDGALDGSIVVSMRDPRMRPVEGAGSTAQKVAGLLERLHRLQQQIDPERPLELVWTIELGGAPWAPMAKGLGLEGLLGSIQQHLKTMAERAAEAGKRQVAEQARELRERARSEAEQGIKDIVEGERDPDEALKDRLESGKDQGKELEDKAKDFIRGLGR